MNLILDFGNTYKKIAVVSQREIVYLTAQKHIEVKDIVEIGTKYDIRNAILSSVVNDTEEIEHYLEERYTFIKLSQETRLPIKNAYETKNTLGSDRLACAVAAYEYFPNENVLVLQLGTCITSDFITKEGVYLGGSISPGMNMRFKALHYFSAKLPLMMYRRHHPVLGKSTQESIWSGVIHGIIAECNYLIDYYKSNYDSVKIILTGGNRRILKNTINNDVLSLKDFVIFGLNAILNYNVEN
jgi:type III pantothenate kinase